MPLPVSNEPGVAIESVEVGPPRRVVYHDLTTGERWAEVGSCWRCGLCDLGSVRETELVWDPAKRKGEPYSCLDPSYDARPEIVNRPMMKEKMARMAAQLGIEGGGCSYDFEMLPTAVE